MVYKVHVEKKYKESLDDIHKKITNQKIVKNILEKMRISGANLWTPIQDVTSSPKESQYIDQMVQNGLLDRQENLVRFHDARTFSIIDKQMK